MLVLTFQVGRDRLALDIGRVKEVVPRVRLQPLAGAPPWLAGVLIYRGQAVPVLDLHHLVGAGDCPPHLSSRIILTPYGDEDRLLGLLAAQVADLRDVQPSGRSTARLRGPGQPDLGPVMIDDRGILHLLELDGLLPETVRGYLALVPREAPA
jgi:chemotaxis-related protein WspB